MKKGCWECCGTTDAIVAEGGGDDGEKGAVEQRDGREGRSSVLDWDICHAASLWTLQEMGVGSALLSRGERGSLKNKYIPIQVGVIGCLHRRVVTGDPVFAFQAACCAVLVGRCVALLGRPGRVLYAL